MIYVAYTLAALFVLHCALPIGAAWYSMRGVPDMFAAKVKYTVLVPLSTAVTWLTMATAPVISFFIQKNGRLPFYLRFAGTHDAWQFAFTTQLMREPMPVTWLQRYWSCLRWVWRNPAYHFAHYVCGYQARRGIVTESSYLQNAELIGNRENGYRALAPWGNAFSAVVTLWRLRVEAGWKLWRTDAQDADGVCMMATKIGFIK